MNETLKTQIKIFKIPSIFTVLILTILIINLAQAKTTQKKDIPIGMALIPEGYFVMGSPVWKSIKNGWPPPIPKKWPNILFYPFDLIFYGFAGEDKNYEIPHKVWVDAFYMDKYLVTFKQYDNFCAATGRKKPDDHGWGRGNRPVINVSWDDANAYAQWVGKRLPTEAEYEKAERAGTDTEYFFGVDASQIDNYAWYKDNSGNMTHPVGEKKPNPYGLYDIIGNVGEYCSDWFESTYYEHSPEKNPKGPTGEQSVLKEHVMRGGSWNLDKSLLRSAERIYTYKGAFEEENGFRCVKMP